MAKSKSGLAASVKAIDPTLDALFADSAGPVKATPATRYAELLPPKERKPLDQPRTAGPDSANDGTDSDNANSSDEEDDDDDDESMSGLEDGDDQNDEDSEDEQPSLDGPGHTEEPVVAPKKDRKRKRRDDHDDLEDNYMRKLAEDEERETRQEKRHKGKSEEATNGVTPEKAAGQTDEEETGAPLVHESLAQTKDDHPDIELDKANRTLFIGNITAEAITSKAKKTLISHLESPLSGLDSSTGLHKIESLRFRSTAFSTGAMPKRAAFITKSLMTATTKSTNAYAVYSTPLAARAALKALNGSIILNRHIRVDSVAHPTAVDHRRCVFVGNLGFVDDETVINTTAEGETTTKKRTKVPADTEEGLWRTFEQHAGKVESVRVPRDEKTRVGKGFAYVQFYDDNDVEAALLLNGKKFPPMLPRILRVSRAKDPRKTALAMERTTKTKLQSLKTGDDKSKSTKYKPKITAEQHSQAGRAGKLFGRSGAARQRHEFKGASRKTDDRKEEVGNGGVTRTPEQIVFEGRRASQKDGKPRDLKFGKGKGKKGAVKAKGRGARRASEWRKKSAAS